MNSYRAWVLVVIAALNDVATAQSVPTISLERPDMIVTSVSTGTELTQIGSVLALPNGRIVVTQPQDRQLLILGPTGAIERTVGGRGAGPGEFTTVGGVRLLGDTLYAMDASQPRRAHLYRLDGSFIRTNVLPGVATPPDGLVGNVTSLLPGSMMLISPVSRAGMLASLPGAARGAQPVPDGPFRNVQLFAASRDGTGLRPIAIYRSPTTPTNLPLPGGGGMSIRQGTFGEQPITMLGPNSDRLLIVDRAAARSGGTSTFSVTVVASTRGDTLWRRAIPYTPMMIPEVERQGLRTAFEAFAGESRTAREEFARVLDRLPRYYAPVTGALLGSDGSAWLAIRGADTTRTDWDVIDSSGRDLMRVRLASRYRIVAVGAEHLLATSLDSDDLPILSRFSLTPGRR